ncbi:hypothetical protein ACP70R_039422 [Stipagrostis hirtigluma subsp. patula]
MRGSSGGVLVCVIAILVVVLFGCGALPVQCSTTQLLEAKGTRRRSYPNSLTNTSSNATEINIGSIDERKIIVKFCIKSVCGSYLHPKICYCCLNTTNSCYDTRDDCKANCPACNPECYRQQKVDRFMQ